MSKVRLRQYVFAITDNKTMSSRTDHYETDFILILFFLRTNLVTSVCICFVIQCVTVLIHSVYSEKFNHTPTIQFVIYESRHEPFFGDISMRIYFLRHKSMVKHVTFNKF